MTKDVTAMAHFNFANTDLLHQNRKWYLVFTGRNQMQVNPHFLNFCTQDFHYVACSYLILVVYIVTGYVGGTRNDSLICLNIRLITSSNRYSWGLDKCFSPRHYIGKGVYTDKCCLRAGKQILTCKTTHGSGWTHSYVMIEDNLFCDDTVGYKSLSRINVTDILDTSKK